jgi:hypothetical protein
MFRYAVWRVMYLTYTYTYTITSRLTLTSVSGQQGLRRSRGVVYRYL